MAVDQYQRHATHKTTYNNCTYCACQKSVFKDRDTVIGLNEAE